MNHLRITSLMVCLLLWGGASASTHTWKDKIKEQNWSSTEAVAPGTRDLKFDAYLTQDQTLRIEESFPEIQRSVEVASDDDFGGMGKSRWKRWCRRNKGRVLRRRPSDLMSLKLVVEDMPIFSDSRLPWRTSSGSETAIVENLPDRGKMMITGQLLLNSDAGTRLEERYDESSYDEHLSKELQKTWAVTSAQGEGSVDLTGLDDVACDFVLGKAKLVLGVHMSHQAAKLTGYAPFDLADVRKLYSQLQRVDVSAVPEEHLLSASVAGMTLAVSSLESGPIDPSSPRAAQVISSTVHLSQWMLDQETGRPLSLSQHELSLIPEKVSHYSYAEDAQSLLKIEMVSAAGSWR